VHIRDAQSRVITIRSLAQLRTVIAAESDNDVDNDGDEEAGTGTGTGTGTGSGTGTGTGAGAGTGTGVTERYTLLVFVDSAAVGCEALLNDEVLYPWPFAGYNYEGSPGMQESGGMWWEVIVLLNY
jgi:hypothetical protein